jgi:hypothetical protein
VVCPPWFPPEGVSSEQLKLPKEKNSGGLFRLVVVARKENYSSLREGQDQKKENLEKRIEYTYESRNSKISRSEPLTVVSSCGTSFGLDVPEEVKSSMCFRFFSAP